MVEIGVKEKEVIVHPEPELDPRGWPTRIEVFPGHWVRLIQDRGEVPEQTVALDPDAMNILIELWR